MKRRTNEQRGFVNFPTNRKNTNEGGTFVRLGVRDKIRNKFDDDWMLCCGGQNQFMMDESYIGDDINGSFEFDYEKMSIIDDYNNAQNKFYNTHFPKKKKKEDEQLSWVDEHVSPRWLSMSTIGSTGWTGNNEDGTDWICTYDDLTEEGKVLYNTFKKLYGDNCEVILMTFIDT